MKTGTWSCIISARTSGETKDLAQSNPAKTKELKDKLEAWKQKTNAPIPTQLNPEYK